MIELKKVVTINPSKSEIKDFPNNMDVSFIEMASVSDKGFVENKVNKKLGELRKGSYKYFKEDDILIAKITPCMENGKCGIAEGLTNNIGLGSSEFHVFRTGKNILPKYLFAILNRDEIRLVAETNMTGASGHKRVPEYFYANIKLPLPPIKIQQKIVDEIEILEKQEKNLQSKIYTHKEHINNSLENLLGKATKSVRLSDTDIFETKIGKRVLKSEISNQGKYPVYSANVFEPFGFIDKELLTDFSISSVLWGIDGDWMVNVISENKPFYPTDHCGYLRIKQPIAKARYIAYCLDKEGQQIGFSRTKRASIDRIEGIKIPLPTMAEQEKVDSEIEKLEQEITKSEKQIAEIPKQKEAILKKYLE